MNIANIKIDDLISQELQHSGVKGMKWGIRKEPEVKSGSAKQIASSTLKVVGGGAIGAGTVATGAVASSAALGALGIFKMKHDFSHAGPAVEAMINGQNKIAKIYPWLLAGGIAVGAGTAAGIVATKAHNKKKKDVSHSYEDSDELYHFNIKGAKWGIRRYQNYDGTLTEAGKLRYGVNSLSEAKPDSKAVKLHAKDVQESYESQKGILQETKNITDSLSNRLSPKRGSKRINKTDYSKMTDDELRKKINRMALEKQYGDLSGDNKYVMSGKEVTRELLQTAGTMAAIGASTVGILLGIKNLRG